MNNNILIIKIESAMLKSLLTKGLINENEYSIAITQLKRKYKVA